MIVPGIRIIGPFAKPEQAKLHCSKQGVQVKLETNTTMRGTLGNPLVQPLCKNAQATFDQFAELKIAPVGQLYGGKICAALDRQHPRDLFDINYLFKHEGFTPEIKRGFLLCLLSSDRPLHEILSPTPIDQREMLAYHFDGMSEEPFSYKDFEQTRGQLIESIHQSLDENDCHFLLSFKAGAPEWALTGFPDFEKFPALQWKLQNIQKLKTQNPKKHQEQHDRLKICLQTIAL